MTLDIESWIFNDTDDVVSSTTHSDIVKTLSAALASKPVAILHILYPRTDARSHQHREALVEALHRHSMHNIAKLIADEAHYLLFRDPAKARVVLHEIRNDSLAIGAHLYYKGLSGDAAEKRLDSDAQALAA